MGKFDGILFVSDLDGTLLRDDITISEENKQAIKYFEDEGGKFSFVTGRIPLGVKMILSQYTPKIPFGCINGGGIYDAGKKEYLWKLELPKSAIELAAYVKHEFPHMGIEIVGFDGSYFCTKNEATKIHSQLEGFEPVECHYSEIKEPLAKILLMDSEDKIPPLMEALSRHKLAPQFDFVRSTPQYYEVLPKGASKGNALLKLAEYLRIDKSRTISVGDNDNDVSMLKIAKLGFAVANSSANALAAADFVTVSNEEHAIAKIIEELDIGLKKI